MVGLAGVYLLVGLVVVVLFFTRWLGKMDSTAIAGSWGFRVLITPGVVVLWPVILIKVFSSKSPEIKDGAEALRRNHRLAFLVLAVVGSIVFIAALVWRAPMFGDLPSIPFPLP